MAIDSEKDFSDTPEGWYNRWDEELKTAEKNLKDFKRRANKTIERYTDQRGDTQHKAARLNLFHSNINTMRSFLFGNAPKSDVSRRNQDANDDVARVAAEMLQRMINNDIEESGNEFSSVLRCALNDRLLPGLGVGRVRYVLETGTKEVDPYIDDNGEEQTTAEYMIREEASIEYVHWDDVLWGWAQTWKDIPWMAFRTYLSKDQATKRFGEEVANQLQYQEIGPKNKAKEEGVAFQESRSAWQKAICWEICHKDTRKCFWLSPGYGKILDVKDDFLNLRGFWPTPEWMMANLTTTSVEPIPDFFFAQDLYNEIDDLYNRICVLTDAVKAVGVYDSAAKEVARLMNEGTDNVLIPVENWQRFAEKNGLEGSIDMLEIESVVAAITQLRDLLTEKINLLFQVTGLSDIMRGQSSQKSAVSAAEQKIKAKFGSVRVQALQDEFAQFASGLAALKAEVICKHFSPKTIIEESGILFTADAQFADQAVALLKKDFDAMSWRIEIKPETVAMTDYAQLQQERVEYLTALATFMQSSQPIAEMFPAAVPVLLELLKWGLAGFKGSQQIEGVLDRAIQQVSAAPPAQKPDPEAGKQKTEQIKQEGKQKEIAMKHQAKMKEIAADTQSDVTKARATGEDQRKSSALQGLIDLELEERRGKNAAMDSKKNSSV